VSSVFTLCTKLTKRLEEDPDLHTIAIVLHLVLDHPCPEDLPQPALEPHTVDVPEVLNDAIVVLQQAQAHQIGGDDHLLLRHEILDDLLREPLGPPLDVRRPQCIPKDSTLHKLQRENLDHAPHLHETVRLPPSRRTESETPPDQRHENGLLYVLSRPDHHREDQLAFMRLPDQAADETSLHRHRPLSTMHQRRYPPIADRKM
jgi:hypothetical protein